MLSVDNVNYDLLLLSLAKNMVLKPRKQLNLPIS